MKLMTLILGMFIESFHHLSYIISLIKRQSCSRAKDWC